VVQGSGAAVYTPLERLVLHFTDEVVQKVKASDALFDELLSHLNHRQMAELVLTIGFYMMVSRFLENFEVEIEPPGVIQ
jgi:4-carboxymuconolactone decarboxylase